MKPSLHSARGASSAFHVAGAALHPTLTGPSAAAGLPERLWRAASRALDVMLSWQDRSRQRRALRHLSHRELRDIGISRIEAEHEARKPFWRT